MPLKNMVRGKKLWVAGVAAIIVLGVMAAVGYYSLVWPAPLSPPTPAATAPPVTPSSRTPPPTTPPATPATPAPTMPPGTLAPPTSPPTPQPVTIRLAQAEVEARFSRMLSQQQLLKEVDQTEVRLVDDRLVVTLSGRVRGRVVSVEGLEARVDKLNAYISGVVQFGKLKIRGNGEAILKSEDGKLQVEIISMRAGRLPAPPPVRERLNQQLNQMLQNLELGLPQQLDEVRIENGELVIVGQNTSPAD